MGVRFTAEVRRHILAATALAQARGQSRPRVRDFTDALASAGLTLPPFPLAALGDDIEALLDAAATSVGSDDVSMDAITSALSGLGQPVHGTAVTPEVAQNSAHAVATHRVGIGYDSHRFAPGGPMRLGGIAIESDVHCAGHSDGDAICHALTDAVLGAAGAGDIGEMFPDSDPANAGRDSVEMLRLAVERLRGAGFAVQSVDVTVIAERPKLSPHRAAMRSALAAPLGVNESQVSLKGKTNEGMGWIGRGEGLAVIAVASIGPATR